ncbi:MAG: hypothetical protein J7L83_02760 [Thaumarchaeota archaeon]|nr:hypothetical protein [Nitrososphaerota archaeon]
MMLETHGDVCRLGYLRIIPCLLEDGAPKTFDFLAALLFDIVKNVRDRDLLATKPIGLITSSVNARNYVTLAAELNLIDRKTQTLGNFGKLYLTSDSAMKFKRFAEGQESLSLIDLITLSDSEKLFFLWALFIQDYPFIQLITNWAVKKERFRRQEAMIYAMEEAYPRALKKALPPSDSRRKEVEEAEKFKERRLSIKDKVEWIKSSQYAKYRHIAPPTLEWLVDCGILKRNGRGKYEVNSQMIYDQHKLLKLTTLKPGKIESYLFNDFMKAFTRWYKPADKYEIFKTLLEVYNRMAFRFGGEVNLTHLECMTSIVLLERGSLAELQKIHDAFNSLALQFPDKIYVTPIGKENINIAYINVEDLEI